MKQIKYLSLFSGIGGFELGIQKAHEILNMGRTTSTSDTEDRRHQSMSDISDGDGWRTNTSPPECIGFSEIDKYAIATYQSHFRQQRTKEEIENDLDIVKTIVSENNYDIMEVCYVNNVKKETSFIKTTNQSVKTALENTNLTGVKAILNKVGLRGENIMLCEDSECSICMGEDVSVVENLKKCSLPLNIETEMGMLSESNMELAICINSPSKKTDQIDTKSCATTVITLKEDTIYAHIKKTKPHKNWGDITKITADTLPDFDLLVGGFPCQSFSIAGKRGGFEDTRGTLFFEIARIIKAKKPRYFLLENVKGLLSHDNGNTFKTIISTLDELGYDCQWEVLNSKNFGVPQNRERVFIVGHSRGTPRPKVFPIGEGNSRIIEESRTEGSIQLASTSISKTISTRHGTTARGQDYIAISGENPNLSSKDTFSTLKQNMGTGGNNTPMILNESKIRRLTPIECERLQGFPDNWTIGSDTQRYKQCGNAVTVNVIQAIMEKLL